MARVVLDAGAVAELAHHLEVERRPLAEPGALERPALGLEAGDPLLHLGLDVDDGFLELVLRRDVVGRRVDVGLLALGEELAGQRVELGDPLDDVAEELDPDERLLRRRLELERVAADAEPGAAHRLVVALVLEVDEVAQDGVAPVLAADPQLEDGRAVVDRRAEAVDARHRGDDDHVASLEQGVRRGVAEPVDLVVARRVLLDVGVAPGQVRLGLVVVEVADEVLDRVLREELAELGVELGGERLVVGEDQGRLVVLRRCVQARVAVLPVPVAPSSVLVGAGPWRGPPTAARSPPGWSPVGSNGATNLKSGMTRPVYQPPHEPNRRSGLRSPKGGVECPFDERPCRRGRPGRVDDRWRPAGPASTNPAWAAIRWAASRASRLVR